MLDAAGYSELRVVARPHSQSLDMGSRLRCPFEHGGLICMRASRAVFTPIGNRRLHQALWMPTLAAVSRCNPWLQTFYRRLIDRGKPHKVALVAAMRKLLAAI